jgi:hypothetical protein
MPDLTAHQRATSIVHDFLEAEFDDQQGAARWLIERIAAALEQAEKVARRGFIPLRAFYPGH